METVQEKINHFISIFRTYKHQIEQLEMEIKQKKASKEIVPALAKEYLGVAKKYVRGAQAYFSSPQEDPFESIKRAIGRELVDIEMFFSTCIIINPNGTKSAKKPQSFISQVKNVSLPKTKVRRALDGLNQLKHLGGNLIFEKDFIPQKQEKEIRKEISISPAEVIWNKIISKDFDFLVEIDESAFFDRKQKGIEADKMEDLIVAMANTNGGVIAFGYTNDKQPFPLSLQKRDGIQNQITNICRTNISPKITPQFESIIDVSDQGHLIVYIQEKGDTLHINSKHQILKRVGSNNVKMTTEEIRKFYTK